MSDFEVKPVESLIPPYTYYNAIRRFLTEFIGHGMPNDVSAILDSFGHTKHQLRSALRSLRLTDERNFTTDLLRRLAKASDEERRVVLQEILRAVYPYMFQVEGFDVAEATREELAEKFKSVGVTKQSTIDRCIDFFRGALKDSGLMMDITTQNGRTQEPIQGVTGANASGRQHPGRQQQQLPPLPPYEASWSNDVKELWIRMRYLEMKA